MLRRALLPALVVVVLAGGLAGISTAHATTLRYTNPIRDTTTGKPLSCPDPSVIRYRQGKWRYFLYCTSDNARNAFPIWRSTDLIHWKRDGYVFGYRHQPPWAMPSDGHTRAGIFWAPAIYRVHGRFVLYFSAAYNPASHAIGSADLKAGTMVLGVATAHSPTGPWHTKLLHFPGELNADNQPPNHEVTGGDIDPGLVVDPRTGHLYLFWAEQREQIWEGQLSSDGLTLGPSAAIAFSVSEPWECDPTNKLCTVEGPQPIYHAGKFYVLYSGASTWDSSYVVGVAASAAALNPALPFVKDTQPILRAGNGFLGPGGESDPVIGPNGQTMIMYHALTHIPTSHASGARVLMLGTLHWAGGFPLINHGVPAR